MKRRWQNLRDGILAVLVLGGISIACFLPILIWLGAYFLLNPQGFWQKAVVFGAGVWLLGGLQVIGLVLFIVLWVNIILH